MARSLSKVTSKAQTTVPKEVREALLVQPGDWLAYEICGDHVIVRKADAYRDAYLDMLNRTFADWASPEDDDAFAYLSPTDTSR